MNPFVGSAIVEWRYEDSPEVDFIETIPAPRGKKILCYTIVVVVDYIL